MGVTSIGFAQGLNDATQGLQSGYYGAIGSVIARNLAQQKQTSETKLQTAEGGYFDGRNKTAIEVASKRADGLDIAEGMRSQAQVNIASMIALNKLPASIAGQTPAVARAMIRAYDAANPQEHMERDVYRDSTEGLFGAGAPSGGGTPSGTGGPGDANLNPMNPTQINFSPPPQPAGMRGVGPVAASMSPSVPGVPPGGTPPIGTPTIGTPPLSAPPIGPAALMPRLSGPGAMGSGMPQQPQPNAGIPALPNAGTPALPNAGTPALPNAGMPPGGGPVLQNLPPQASGFVPGTNPNMAPNAVNNGDAPPNPFKVSPVAESIINKNNATADKFTSGAELTRIKAQMYPKLTVSQISENLAKAGLFSSEGKFYDVRTGEVVRMDDARIGLEDAQGKALATNAGANAYKADVYGKTQPVIAAADATRAGADVTRAGADVSKAASYAKSVDNTGQYQSGMLGIDHEKIIAAGVNSSGKLKNGFTPADDSRLAAETQKNETEAARLQHLIDSGKQADGVTPLTYADSQRMAHIVTARRSRNAEVNGWLNDASGGLGAIAAGQPGASSAPNGGYTGPIPNNQAEYKKMTSQQLYEYKNVYLKWRNNNK